MSVDENTHVLGQQIERHNNHQNIYYWLSAFVFRLSKIKDY